MKNNAELIEARVQEILRNHTDWNVETNRTHVSISLGSDERDSVHGLLVDAIMEELKKINPDRALRLEIERKDEEIQRLKADLHARSMKYGSTFMFCQKLMDLGNPGEGGNSIGIIASRCTPGGHSLEANFSKQQVFFRDSERICGMVWSREPDERGCRAWSCMPQLPSPWEEVALQQLGFAVAKAWMDRGHIFNAKVILSWCVLYQHRWTTGACSEYKLEGGRE